jgi:uncharacterized protein (DUF427 family)
MQAIWNDTVIADSDDTVVVEGNHYFPPDAINSEYFKPSATTSVCPWKGTASYYTLEVAGQQNPDAAWYYPETKTAADEVRDGSPSGRACRLLARKGLCRHQKH